MKAKAIRMNDRDNVATAIGDLASGEKVVVKNGKEMEVTVRADIQFGHKFAVKSIGKGDDVMKYGEVIGRATKDIAKGDHVHVHNIESLRGRGDIPDEGVKK
ncbi:MAG: UxaA family hydrolase [Methanomassiliicoccales archaeon]|nr:UxaA family hydrolase [Methanomassiliicoccales archaeon]